VDGAGGRGGPSINLRHADPSTLDGPTRQPWTGRPVGSSLHFCMAAAWPALSPAGRDRLRAVSSTRDIVATFSDPEPAVCSRFKLLFRYAPVYNIRI
jgi:hypothetical protein